MIVRIPKARELLEALRSLFSKPITVELTPNAITTTSAFRGKPVFDEAHCIGCGACAAVCPAQAISVRDRTDVNPPMREFKIRYDVCIFCGHCELNCTTEGGVYHTTEFDLSTMDRSTLEHDVAKELVLCGECGCAIAAKEHLLWVAERLGPKRFSNPTLMLVSGQELGIVDNIAGLKTAEGLRADGMRALCPTCRRATIVKEHRAIPNLRNGRICPEACFQFAGGNFLQPRQDFQFIRSHCRFGKT